MIARVRRVVLLGVAGLALMVAGIVFALRSPRTTFTPFLAPSFALPGLRDGEATVDLAVYRGRPVVLNFFFSTCKPCADELPRFQAEAEHRGDAVVFLGIDHFEPLADGRAIVKRTKIRYPVGFDRTGTVAPTYGAIAFPTTVFIDRDGIVRSRFIAAMSESALRRNIDAISRSS